MSLRSRNLLSKSEARRRQQLTSNKSSKKKIRHLANSRLAQLQLPLTMLKWESSKLRRRPSKIRTKSCPSHQTNSMSVTRRKKTRRKMSLLQLLTRPLNQLPLPRLKKLPKHFLKEVTQLRKHLLILNLKLLQTWRTLKESLNLKTIPQQWLMPVLVVKILLLKTSLK